MKVLIIPLAVSCALAGAAQAQDLIVKIGHVGPVSGALAHLGKDNENGARMALYRYEGRKKIVLGGSGGS